MRSAKHPNLWLLRLALPAAYLLVCVLYGAFYIKGLGGHGNNPFEFVYLLMFPAAYLLDLIPGKWLPENALVSIILASLLGLIQWLVLGYAADKLIMSRKNPNPR